MSRDTGPVIGLVRVPGAEPHTFTFLAADRAQRLKTGEFVAYHTRSEGSERTVLARVVDRIPLRVYPASFLSDPAISADAMAQMIGYSGRQTDLFELTGEVVGYFDETLRAFVNPRVLPPLGAPVYLASNELLKQVLSRHKTGETGAANVGWLLSREQGEVPVVVDLGAIASTHLAIIASTGAGKSYLASVLIEELMMPNNRAAVLVIDPHGEYDTLTDMQGHEALRTDGYQPEVTIYRPGEVKLRIGTLTMGDLRYLLPNLSERMGYVLGIAYREAQQKSRATYNGHPDRWTLDELLEEVAVFGGGEYETSATALQWRLESALRHTVLFDDRQQVRPQDLVQPGKCSVLQLSEVDQREQQVMVAALMRRIYDARRMTHKQQADTTTKADFYLPYPVFTLMEEAHHFAPANADVVSTGILKTILGEGRKFGVGIGLISQRPGKLDPDVLSQCNTQCLLRIINPVDQARIAESVESVGRDLLKQLPALSKGQAIITGSAVNTPLLCRVRTRHTPHGAEDISAPEAWMSYFRDSQQTRREREGAPLSRPQNSGKGWDW